MFTFTDWLFENKDALGTGPGLWCPLHIALVVIILVWLVVAFFIFRKYKNFSRKFTFALCIIMPAVRILRMIVQLASGEYSFVEILPWHLCHLMSFVLPIFYFTKTKKFFLPVLVASFFGGVYHLYLWRLLLSLNAFLLSYRKHNSALCALHSGHRLHRGRLL